MEFPSLLFTGPVPARTIEAHVLEDIKLTLLVQEDTIPALLHPCETKDILARQCFFRLLDDANVREHLNLLSSDMTEILRCHTSFQEARCNNEKYVIYLSLLNALVRFCKDAADSRAPKSGCELYDRFTEHFSGIITESHFTELTDSIQDLYPLIETIQDNRMRMHESKIYVSAVTPPSFEERLARCAADLGFGEFTPHRNFTYFLAPQVIDAIAELYPQEFRTFRDFYESNMDFFREEVLNYDIELKFYIDLCAVIDRVRSAGIPLTYPGVSVEKHVDIRDCYDITLLAKEQAVIVPNDVIFNADTPFYYLTGANGGGKTTYLRTIGVAILLFLNGCPIACQSAEIYPLEMLFTHFPRDERFDGNGRFADERRRADQILDKMGDSSMILLNETFATTNEEFAIQQTVSLAEAIYPSGCFGLYITHQHAIGSADIPFLHVIVDQNDENRRTYKISRQKGAAGSFALDILKKYHLTKEELDQRFPEESAEGGNHQ